MLRFIKMYLIHYMRKYWLTFAQTVTVCLAVVFVMRFFYPQLLVNQIFGAKDTHVAINQTNLLPVTSRQNTYSNAVKKAMPAVVNIFTSKKAMPNPHQQYLDDPLFKHFFGDQLNDSDSPAESSLGSGVIVSDTGLILTNDHVVASADHIEIAMADGRKLSAIVVGTDPETDLAVIKVEAKNLPAITFASSEKIDVGDIVLAIGNPFGVGQTVTQGIISALGRNHLGINTFENFIQTDASINPGNSGGALINTEGNLVGINSAIYSRTGGSMGIGFAIPANLAQQVMQQIITDGSVTRGWIGIEAQDITPGIAASFKLHFNQGALISGILRGSPADKAGLKAGDILLAINGQEVTDSNSMLNLISVLKPKNKVQLKIIRTSKEMDIPVLVGRRPKIQTEK